MRTSKRDTAQGGPAHRFRRTASMITVHWDFQTRNFGPDTIWNYELGAKTEWLEKRLTIDSSIYYIQWHNIQQTLILPCSAAFIGNFGVAQSKGVDLDAHYVVLEGLRVDFSGAVNEAHLTKTVAGAQGVPGQSLEYAPK